jgi:DNA-binding Lrp family transcriptional regulator
VDNEAQQVGWSLEEDRRLARMYMADDPPATIREIADELEKSKSAVDRRITTLGFRGHKGDRAEFEKLTGVALEPVIRPVRVEVPAPPRWKAQNSDYSVLVWGDVHFPFQDDLALEVLRRIARDLRPRKIVCLGDTFDFFELSDHRPPRDRSPDIQQAINEGTQHLADIRNITGAEEAYFLGGNHEDRWDRMLQRATFDVRFRQLLQLPKIKRALEFAEVVGFDELGYTYQPYTEGNALVENDRLVYIHGEHANKYVARTTLEKFGKNIIFGHMHRIQNYSKRDLKGQEAGWCIGCLCALDPHYDPFADWQQGFAIVNWSKVGGDWLFNVEQIRIHNGRAIWRDQVYQAE